MVVVIVGADGVVSAEQSEVPAWGDGPRQTLQRASGSDRQASNDLAR